VAGEGVRGGAPLHDLPSGPEPGHMVNPPGQSAFVRGTDHAAGAHRATIMLHADDTVEHRSRRKIGAKGRDCDAVRSTKKHVIRCFGLNGCR
jgi:hypothetical protein